MAASRRRRSTRPETIRSSASRVGFDVFEAPIHFMAREMAVAAGAVSERLGMRSGSLDDPVEDGFITSAGRFVGREEAHAIAASQGMVKRVRPVQSWFEPGLEASSLGGYDRGIGTGCQGCVVPRRELPVVRMSTISEDNVMPYEIPSRALLPLLATTCFPRARKSPSVSSRKTDSNADLSGAVS